MDGGKSLAQRLNSEQYDYQDALNGLRGEKIPEHLGYPLLRLCTIRGIRHSLSFAESEAATLRDLPEYPEFTRALNARAIMSNRIPKFSPTVHPEHIPYCIWCPDIASEDTYRQLASRYPLMAYQVGRACAAAGYTQLYLELDLLPEISIAEEARDAGNDKIFQHVMAQPVRYRIMDDYFRKLHLDNPQPSSLNGDTCVLSLLKHQKQQFTTPSYPDDDFGLFFTEQGFSETMFNITEDHGVAESVPEPTPGLPFMDFMLHLLTSPLPVNFPAGNKDLLILTAALYGNIDRYTRLRRPKAHEYELFCIVRGIYHNSLFALWWSRQHNASEEQPFHIQAWDNIQQAIMARHIMNNDLSYVLARKGNKDHYPYLIWNPDIATIDTYRALAREIPEMREACVRAAIYANLPSLFDEVLALSSVEPNRYLLIEASRSNNSYFSSTLESRVKEFGIDIDRDGSSVAWKRVSVRDTSILRRGSSLASIPSKLLIHGEFIEPGAIYNGVVANADALELFLMAPESWRPEKEFREVDYKHWPSRD